MRTQKLAAGALSATFVAAAVVSGCGGGSGGGGDEAGIAKERGRAASWPTYQQKVARTGVDATSPPIGQVRRTWTKRLDAPVYGQPLAVRGRVYVATENNTVYALSA